MVVDIPWIRGDGILLVIVTDVGVVIATTATSSPVFTINTHSHNSPSHVIILVLGWMFFFSIISDVFSSYLCLILSDSDFLTGINVLISIFVHLHSFSTAKQQAIYCQFPDNGVVVRHVI